MGRHWNPSRQLALAALAAAMVLATSAFSTTASASPIAIGAGPTVTPGTATLAGLSLVDDETVPFIGLDSLSNEVFKGTLEARRVYSDPSTGGDYDFAFQIIAGSPEPDSIHTLTLTSYANFTTDIDYVTAAGDIAYDAVSRSSTFGGFRLTFDYSNANAIVPGDTADWILIKTNAPTYAIPGTAAIIDGGNANVQVFEPALPEPASLGVLMVVGGGMLIRRRRFALGK